MDGTALSPNYSEYRKSPADMDPQWNTLRLKRLGIGTYRENIIFMRSDCHICKSEGFTALTRVQVHFGERSIIATINVVDTEILKHNEAVLSEEAFSRLGATEGDTISVSHVPPIESLRFVRAKLYGRKLDDDAFTSIVADITAGMYSNIELAAFISACSGTHLDLEEITALTRAMIGSGTKMSWGKQMILDKHCVGGLPGNRTTPILVAIAAAAGLTIPKTSSRAITSPAGTADTMETITRVALTTEEIAAVVSAEGGCIAWGGAVKLSPADDIVISVERSLDLDSEGQMIASVLSKKVAAGSTHVVIDMPVGDTAKVRTTDDAERLRHYFKAVGNAIGISVEVLITDGRQPVGRGIGPSLEAMDVLAVLRNEKDAPADLRDRALLLAGTLLELAGVAPQGQGAHQAAAILDSGEAWKKFQRICLAQGGLYEPVLAKFSKEVKAMKTGRVVQIDNRRLSRLAKLLGAPKNPSAGIRFFAPLGKSVQEGQTMFVLYAESEGELEYALQYYSSTHKIITIA